jgi:S-DNA-T family DNA segregation ATPase FtsK/SpoIIIE
VRLCVTWEGSDVVIDSRPGATIAELRAVLPGAPKDVWVDGFRAEDDSTISTIPNGATLTVSAGPRRARTAGVELGKVTFNRPPRIVGPADPVPPSPPELPLLPDRRVRFRWATTVVSLLTGLVLAVVFGPTMAVFSLLGPVMAVGTWLEERSGLRHERNEVRAGALAAADRYRRARLRWERQLSTLQQSRLPDPAEVELRARSMAPTIWERRPHHRDFGLVSVGVSDAAAPFEVALSAGRTIGITGHRGLDVARWMIVQAAVHHGPADVEIRGPCNPEWEWLKWLPHTNVSAPLRVRVGEETPGACCLAIADDRTCLPGNCDVVIDAATDGAVSVVRPSDGSVRTGQGFTVSELQALAVARELARLRDPEFHESSAGATLQELLGFPTAESIGRCWSAAGHDLRAPIGTTTGGTLEIDLIEDGPHGLLAGTTGSGKSELLRTLVLSLAARYSPRRIVFVLIDYKGGATFDVCAGLPHVAGSMTDLDPLGAARVLEALEIEIREREERLRAAGLPSVDDGPLELPHLLVVIDEFAALAEQAPAILDGLIDIARRGRSLGMHLLLATQRPAGVVSDRVRANTSIRIALRVHDRSDSEDVLGVGAAADIGRRSPGRGFLRLGPGELVGFQTAPASTSTDRVTVTPFLPDGRSGPSPARHDDIERLVGAILSASRGIPPARPVWSPQLPDSIGLEELPSTPRIAFGLVDDPRERRVLEWNQTNVLFVDSSGVESARSMAALATAICNRFPDSHVHAVGVHDGHVRDLEALEQTGGLADAGDVEVTDRLYRYLLAQIEGRRRRRSAGPPVLLVVEDLVANDHVAGIVSTGPSVGVFTIASIRHVGAIGAGLLAGFPERFAFKLVDPYEYPALGVSEIPNLPPGEAISVSSRRPVLIARPRGRPARGPAVRPHRIEALPLEIPLVAVERGAVLDDRGIFVPIGMGGDATIGLVGFRLAPGRHAVITGPRGAGKTSTLRTVAVAALGRLPVTSVGDLDVAADQTVDTLSECLDDPGDVPRLCLVDDAHREEIDHRRLPQGLHLVAAAAAGDIEHGHWLRRLAADAEGLALQPDFRDEDLWRTRLPSSTIPGRGVLVRGRVPIQVASGTMAAPSKEDTDNARSDRNRRNFA